MSKLIAVKENTLYTTTVIIADQLKTGVRSFDKDIHRNVNIAIEKLLSKDVRFVDQTPRFGALVEESRVQPTPQTNAEISGFAYIIEGVSKKPKGMRLTEGNVYRTLTNGRGEEYSLIAYRGKNNKLALTWSMNEKAFLRVIMRLSGYRNADEMQSNIIDAFMMMREIIKNQPQPIDNSLFGELSKTGNGLARTKPVRPYYRSDKHSELSVLLGKRKRLQNRLSGFFDNEIIAEIEKIDIEISGVQKTIEQERLTRQLQEKKLLK